MDTKKEQEKLPLDISAETLAKWKHDYGTVHYLGIKEKINGKQLGGYFRAVDFTTLKAVEANAKNNSDMDGTLTLYNNCKLFVSPEIEASDTLKLSLFKELSKLTETYETEAKKF